MSPSIRKMLVLALAGIIGIAALTTVILKRRHHAGWLPAPCGELRWSRGALPIPVYVDDLFDPSWPPEILAALAIIDPKGKLFDFKGVVTATSPAARARVGGVVGGEGGGGFAQRGTVFITPLNETGHGKTDPEFDKAACLILAATVRLPALIETSGHRRRATAHELGHALGLSHSDWEGDLEYPESTSLFPLNVPIYEREMLDGAYVR